MMQTKPHEMEKRVRFGSDGNSVFVVASTDGGRSWSLFDDPRRFARSQHFFALPEDEVRAAVAYLRCEWDPGQPMPRNYGKCSACGRGDVLLLREDPDRVLHDAPDGSPCDWSPCDWSSSAGRGRCDRCGRDDVLLQRDRTLTPHDRTDGVACNLEVG